jgi:hypothetical protein
MVVIYPFGNLKTRAKKGVKFWGRVQIIGVTMGRYPREFFCLFNSAFFHRADPTTIKF